MLALQVHLLSTVYGYLSSPKMEFSLKETGITYSQNVQTSVMHCVTLFLCQISAAIRFGPAETTLVAGFRFGQRHTKHFSLSCLYDIKFL